MRTSAGKSVCLSAAIFSLVLLSGCSSSSPGGGDTKVVQQQSYGQQLIDLDAAHKQGLMTDKEYEKSRKVIIDKMKD